MPTSTPSCCPTRLPLSLIHILLLIHGNQDGTVPFRQSEILYEQLLANGTPVEFYELEGADHADRHFVQPQIREIILDFFNRTLK